MTGVLVVASFRAIGDAVVTVTHDSEARRFAGDCETCGPLKIQEYPDAGAAERLGAQSAVINHARAHAGYCRALPARLWPAPGNGGS